MQLDHVAKNGLVLLGCGKMGSAMLQGWLAGGLPATSVWVLDPHPSDWLLATGVQLNQGLPAAPAIVLIAVKPQMMTAALPGLAAIGGGKTLFLSIAAGTTIAYYESVLGAQTPIIRAMPNTPAAVARGISAITDVLGRQPFLKHLKSGGIFSVNFEQRRCRGKAGVRIGVL